MSQVTMGCGNKTAMTDSARRSGVMGDIIRGVGRPECARDLGKRGPDDPHRLQGKCGVHRACYRHFGEGVLFGKL